MEKIFYISDEAGLHARPATNLVNVAGRFDSDLYLEYLGRKVNLKSIMGVMSLGVSQGAEIKIIADGHDEEQAIEAITEFLKNQAICK